MTALLEVDGLEAAYGPVRVLHGVSLMVPDGGAVALIGANGAGKSTTLRAVTGLLRPLAGSVRFGGHSLVGLPAEAIAARGIALVPEGRRLFAGLSVEENLEMGAYLATDRAAVRAGIEHVYELFPILGERRRQDATTLSGGEQQMVAIGRAMMSRPRLLLLDEPTLGLAPRIVAQILEVLRAIRAGGTAIALVEQNSELALRFADRAYVLETGRVALSGPAAELLDDPQVRQVYLGY